MSRDANPTLLYCIFPIDCLPLGTEFEEQERIHSNLPTISRSIVEKNVLEMVVPQGCAVPERTPENTSTENPNQGMGKALTPRHRGEKRSSEKRSCPAIFR
jgi:hypothetical protein